MVSNLFSLWPHQDEAVSKIERAWHDGYRSICYQLSTGGGKSRVIRQIVDNHEASKRVIYIVAHRKQLVKQLSEEISDAGIRHGIIAAGQAYVRYRVQVCSIQTLVRRLDKLPPPELIIIDEFHHAKSATFLQILNQWPMAQVLGVTATPRRPDGKPLSDVADVLITGPSMRELINDKYLADYEYFAPDDVDMTGAHTRHGEYVTSEALARVDKSVITGSAVEHYRKYADHLPAIASCVSIAHAEHVAAQFAEAGYRARAVHSKMTDRYITESIQGLRDGTVEILSQCELLGEGVDIRGAVALIGLRPTASEVIFLQHIGRVLRVDNGKAHAIILDHVGNWTRHGLPDDDRQWTLDGVIKSASEKSRYKRCPECLRPVAVSARRCQHCGYVWNLEPVERIPEERDGELVSIRDMRQTDKNDLVIEIARRAGNLKQAVKVAKEHGVDHRGAYVIWTRVLRNHVDTYVKTG